MKDFAVIFCTCPDDNSAAAIAGHLVDTGLAACVNTLSGIISTYQWQGQRETSEERLLIIKTRRALYPKIETEIRAKHPYELPEIIMVSIDAGLPDYLTWIADATPGS